MSAIEPSAFLYDRAAAWALLTEWTQSESLRKHALGVETCVVAYGDAEAERLGLTGATREDLLNLYATTALLHDFDYERHGPRSWAMRRIPAFRARPIWTKCFLPAMSFPDF
jgi:predicted hydrolase (HD superfamily)